MVSAKELLEIRNAEIAKKEAQRLKAQQQALQPLSYEEIMQLIEIQLQDDLNSNYVPSNHLIIVRKDISTSGAQKLKEQGYRVFIGTYDEGNWRHKSKEVIIPHWFGPDEVKLKIERVYEVNTHKINLIYWDNNDEELQTLLRSNFTRYVEY